tara:strand:- start:120 stop:719 length:600 start_codon:yes stop_codon:yes gene_type:complete
MKIKTAEFIISNTNYKNCPEPRLPEYTFIGRSNVGKSTLINSLVNKKKLAKTSSTPGKTQLINHFLINNEWYMVDLPGYGYAKTSKHMRRQFHDMITNYLKNRNSLMCLFVLIDSRHPPQKIDQEFMKWLAENTIPFVIVFTKSDKLAKTKLSKNIEIYMKHMLYEWENLPQIFVTSAEKKIGINEILNFIKDLNPKFR